MVEMLFMITITSDQVILHPITAVMYYAMDNKMN
jgi:hypothetical protein